MNEHLYRAVRQRVAIVLAVAEDENIDGQTLELELRFGEFDRSGRFAPGLPNGLWYALFECMSRSSNTRIECGVSMVERDDDDDSVRIVHTTKHRRCVRESKAPIAVAVDQALFDATASAIVRVAASRETRLGDNVCANVQPSSIPSCVLRRRERRSVYLIDNKGMRSCWRFDFTRIDDKMAYELEIELDVRSALAQTSQLDLTARGDAVMRQLDSLLACLRFSLEQADRMHRANVEQIVAHRQRERARLMAK